MEIQDIMDTDFGREHIMFSVVGQTWYDSETDSFTDVPPNVVLGEN